MPGKTKRPRPVGAGNGASKIVRLGGSDRYQDTIHLRASQPSHKIDLTALTAVRRVEVSEILLSEYEASALLAAGTRVRLGLSLPTELAEQFALLHDRALGGQA